MNIYKNSREIAGLTQERAAELLNISVRSVQGYEAGVSLPPNKIVGKMMDIYHAPHLGALHIRESSELGREVLPAVAIRDLAESVLLLQKSIADFMRVQGALIEIACDGVVADDENGTWEEIESNVDNVCAAAYALKYARRKGASSDIHNGKY